MTKKYIKQLRLYNDLDLNQVSTISCSTCVKSNYIKQHEGFEFLYGNISHMSVSTLSYNYCVVNFQTEKSRLLCLTIRISSVNKFFFLSFLKQYIIFFNHAQFLSLLHYAYSHISVKQKRYKKTAWIPSHHLQ